MLHRHRLYVTHQHIYKGHQLYMGDLRLRKDMQVTWFQDSHRYQTADTYVHVSIITFYNMCPFHRLCSNQDFRNPNGTRGSNSRDSPQVCDFS